MLRKYSSIFDRLPNNIDLSEQSLEADIHKCESVIYRGSTAIVNAINAGLTPIYYQQYIDEPSIDPIFQCLGGKHIVHNESELNHALCSNNSIQNKKILQVFAQEFYTPLNIKPLLKEFSD